MEERGPNMIPGGRWNQLKLSTFSQKFEHHTTLFIVPDAKRTQTRKYSTIHRVSNPVITKKPKKAEEALEGVRGFVDYLIGSFFYLC